MAADGRGHAGATEHAPGAGVEDAAGDSILRGVLNPASQEPPAQVAGDPLGISSCVWPLSWVWMDSQD